MGRQVRYYRRNKWVFRIEACNEIYWLILSQTLTCTRVRLGYNLLRQASGHCPAQHQYCKEQCLLRRSHIQHAPGKFIIRDYFRSAHDVAAASSTEPSITKGISRTQRCNAIADKSTKSHNWTQELHSCPQNSLRCASTEKPLRPNDDTWAIWHLPCFFVDRSDMSASIASRRDLT